MKARHASFSGVSAAVLVLLILGTGYDYYLTRKARRRNVIYDLEKHGKLDPLTNGGLGNRKVLNGKGSSECSYALSSTTVHFTCNYLSVP